MSGKLQISTETTRKLAILLCGMVVAIGIVAIGAGLIAAIDVEPPEEPLVSYTFNQNSETGAANITYVGAPRGETVLFAENVTVSHSGQNSTWNGETESGVIRIGSTHTITSVESGETIRIIAYDSQYEEPAVIEFTVE